MELVVTGVDSFKCFAVSLNVSNGPSFISPVMYIEKMPNTDSQLLKDYFGSVLSERPFTTMLAEISVTLEGYLGSN